MGTREKVVEVEFIEYDGFNSNETKEFEDVEEAWNLFFNKLEGLNNNISATAEEKNEVYNILVEHNKKAKIDFLIRLTMRKYNKMIKNDIAYNHPKEISKKS